MPRGKFITLEGPEGSGKTTQARMLIDRLESRGIRVVYTREPGGTPTGEAIRNILQHDAAGEPIYGEAEVLLFAASRAQLVRSVILPALATGQWVVCDRYADSTTAYQGYGRQFGPDAMRLINAFAIGRAVPDRTVLLDVTVETGFQRLEQRHAQTHGSHDRIEQEERAFHERVRDGYLELAQQEPERWRVLQADGSLETVAQAVWETVHDLL